MRTSLTIAIWALSLASVAIGGLIAAALAIMPVSMDPTDMVTQGADPWIDALWAIAAFVGLLVVAGLGLRLWHSARFKALGLALTAAEVAAVGWASLWAWREYF